VSADSPCLRLLGELVAAKRTGTLSISTPSGAAEVRLADGDVLDAVYLRAEGEKALYRILAASEVTATFLDGGDAGMRRIRARTADLLASAPAFLTDLATRRRAFAAAGARPLLAVDRVEPPSAKEGAPRALSSGARSLLHYLRTPIVLDELLDVAPGSDIEILQVLAELEHAGRLRSLPSTDVRVPLGTSEQIGRLASVLLERLPPAVDAAAPTARLVFAGTVHRLAVLAHSTSCIQHALPPAFGVPAVPMPHPVARIGLGEGPQLTIEIVVCPLVPAYAPLWPMALASSVAVVRLDDAGGTLLESAAEAANARVFDASMLVGPYDEANVAEVAMLVRAALEG
jgi:hypothetical protein